MPGLNGTGPIGKGPRIGRGHGICGIGIRNLGGIKSCTFALISFAVPAVTAVITDVHRKDGIIRRLYRALKDRLTRLPNKGSLPNSSVNYVEDAQKKNDV